MRKRMIDGLIESLQQAVDYAQGKNDNVRETTLSCGEFSSEGKRKVLDLCASIGYEPTDEVVEAVTGTIFTQEVEGFHQTDEDILRLIRLARGDFSADESILQFLNERSRNQKWAEYKERSLQENVKLRKEYDSLKRVYQIESKKIEIKQKRRAWRNKPM